MCAVRNKALEDRPEERVRQKVLRRLLDDYGYRRQDLDVELDIAMGSDERSADIGIFLPGDPHVQRRVQIIIECKHGDVPERQLRSKTHRQLDSYLAASGNALWGVATNGKSWIVLRRVKLSDGTREYIEQGDIPVASSLQDSVRTHESSYALPVQSPRRRKRARSEISEDAPPRSRSGRIGAFVLLAFTGATVTYIYNDSEEQPKQTQRARTVQNDGRDTKRPIFPPGGLTTGAVDEIGANVAGDTFGMVTMVGHGPNARKG